MFETRKYNVISVIQHAASKEVAMYLTHINVCLPGFQEVTRLIHRKKGLNIVADELLFTSDVAKTIASASPL